MGFGLALAAYDVANRARLGHAPTRVYVYMATVASDADPTPTFFGGRDALTNALGVDSDPNGYRAVERAVQALRKAVVVTQCAKGAPGRNARYSLRDETGQPLTTNTRRSASPVEGTPDAERPVSNPEHPTLSGETPDAERREHPTFSVPQKEGKELREGKPPSRFCPKHPKGTAGIPCGACKDARLAADAWKPPKSPPRQHVHDFSTVSGYCTGCELREDAA